MQEKLEFLIALATEKHFGRAAQVCGVSQPNLSAAIKQLESTMGVPLVDRGARFIGFTPEGERVLEWARRIVGDYKAMRADVETMKQGLTGTLRLVVVPTALPMVQRLTATVWSMHPGIKITIASHSSTEICPGWKIWRRRPGSPISTTNRSAMSTRCRSITSATT